MNKTYCIILFFIITCPLFAQDEYSNRIRLVAESKGMRLTDHSTRLINQELVQLTQQARNSQVSEDEIQETNDKFINEILDLYKSQKLWNDRSKDFGEGNFFNAKPAIFSKIAKLIFITTPDDVEVSVNEYLIGNTRLEKAFDCENTYVFVFKKKGYKTVVRSYTVRKYPNQQYIKQELQLDKSEN